MSHPGSAEQHQVRTSVKVRVAICDDHDLVLEGLRAVLGGDGTLELAGTAVDGEEALRLVADTRPDVLLLDIMLPRMSGIAVAERLRVRAPDVRVLALTGSDDPALFSRILDSGFAGFISKGAPAGELLEAIHIVAAGGSYLDPHFDDDPDEEDGPPEPNLSPREAAVARALARGYTNKEVAAMLDISVKTVETHRANVFRKLDLHGRADLIQKAIRWGWLDGY